MVHDTYKAVIRGYKLSLIGGRRSDFLEFYEGVYELLWQKHKGNKVWQ